MLLQNRRRITRYHRPIAFDRVNGKKISSRSVFDPVLFKQMQTNLKNNSDMAKRSSVQTRLAELRKQHATGRNAAGTLSSLTPTTMPGDLGETRLVALERIIEQNLSAFIAAGEALLEIRDNELYLSAYASFEVYCQERWKLSRQHAYRLMEAAPIARCHPRVTSERVARELAKVSPEDREKILDKVEAAEGVLTAPAIKRVVDNEKSPAFAETPVEKSVASGNNGVPREESARVRRIKRLLTEISRSERELVHLWLTGLLTANSDTN
jgi:hypothetical protein